MDKYLTVFWISFPEDTYYPLGFGVTAFSVEDAFRLLEKYNFDYHNTAQYVKIKENVEWQELDDHVRPNAGPIVVRGVWYPHFNSR